MPARREVLGLAISSSAVIAAAAVTSGRGFATQDRAVPTPQSSPDTKLGDTERLNVALNLAYLGAQYHRTAAAGAGLPPHLLAGIGEQGAARGGRKVAFRDPELARYAAEIAADKTAHVAALRSALGGAAAAQPAIDLTPDAGPTSFDPFSGDTSFLLGAFMVGDQVAACQRMLLLDLADANTRQTVAALLADAIYHGGLIRSLLDAEAAADPTIARALASLSALRRPSHSPRNGDYAADLTDAAGNAIPFLRSPARAMTMPHPSTANFFPAGFNGIAS